MSVELENVPVYYCPCCGYHGLDGPPYEHLGPPPWNHPGPPPYDRWYGRPSYDVCVCCGFEFGNDDDPGTTAPPSSFEEYRQKWIKEGCKWWREKNRPPGWRLEEQLAAAGIVGEK